MQNNLKIALAHDYLAEYGGAERVLEAIHELFPEAPVFVSFLNKESLGRHYAKFQDWDIRESWITKIPFYKKIFSPLRVFSPQFFSSFDLSDYDVVISSTNAYFSKAVKVTNGTHICYCHTPARSLYGYTTMTDWKKNPIINFFGSLINHYLRIVDVKIARTNVDHFIANSEETKRRIKKFYKLDSTVIYPPILVPKNPPQKKEINVFRSEKDQEQKPYFLYVGRLAMSKHVDLLVQVANKYDLNFKIAGDGKIRESLEVMVEPHSKDKIEFLGAVSDQKLVELYQNATALIFPAEDEDLGMVPLEAMAYGIPVVAHRSGGPLETVLENQTGVFFDEFTAKSLYQAIVKINVKKWDKNKIYQHALKFSKENFHKQILEFIAKVVNK